MSDTPWTPGPWDATLKQSIHCEYAITSGSGETMYYIADTFGGMEYEHANARLIAAAPEMAELLEEWIYSTSGFGDLAEQSAALLSKIKGQTDGTD